MCPKLPAKTEPIFLSKAHVSDLEVEAVTRAVLSGWVTPLGPEVDAFEREISDFVGIPHAVALASGTSALQLGLKALGIEPGDDVIVPTLTFAATAFAVVHAGANPVFLDVEDRSWNLDPELLRNVLEQKQAANHLPTAVIPVDLLGRTADYEPILAACSDYGVPVLADAAESLGATYREVNAGSLGDAAVFSFNGNKIMTTSGGGMLVSHDEALIERVRFWSTQSREPMPWYEHQEIGYNYRMSNILAALGRAQLERLPEMIARRTQIREMYIEGLGEIDGIRVQGDPTWGRSNNWLTSILLDPDVHSMGTILKLQEALAEQRIEVRPVWKPMHQQPVFAGSESHLTGVADKVFATALCLPSGAGLSDDEISRVIDAISRVIDAIRGLL